MLLVRYTFVKLKFFLFLLLLYYNFIFIILYTNGITKKKGMMEMIESKKMKSSHNSVTIFDCQVFKLTEHINGRYYLTLKEFNNGGYVQKRGNDLEKIQSIVFDTLYQLKGASFEEIMKSIKQSLGTDKSGFYKKGYNKEKVHLYYKDERICAVPKENYDDLLLFCEDLLLSDLQNGDKTVEDVKHILNDTFPYIRIHFKKPKISTEKQVTLDFADSMKLEKQLEQADIKVYELEKELNVYKKFELLLRKKKAFECPNCGSPLKWIQLSDSDKTKQTNRGRLAICCTAKSKKNEKGKCAYLRPIDELDFYVHHKEIMFYSSSNEYVKGEWEVYNSNHPNFISRRILEWYKCFIESQQGL